MQDEPYLVTCPQHAPQGRDRRQHAGTEAAHNAVQGYNRGADSDDQGVPNGDMLRYQALDRSGMACHSCHTVGTSANSSTAFWTGCVMHWSRPAGEVWCNSAMVQGALCSFSNAILSKT